MSIQYTVLRFELTTFGTCVSSHYHQTRPSAEDQGCRPDKQFAREAKLFTQLLTAKKYYFGLLVSSPFRSFSFQYVGYGRRLVFKRSFVRILQSDSGWTFFNTILQQINEKNIHPSIIPGRIQTHDLHNTSLLP